MTPSRRAGIPAMLLRGEMQLDVWQVAALTGARPTYIRSRVRGFPRQTPWHGWAQAGGETRKMASLRALDRLLQNPFVLQLPPFAALQRNDPSTRVLVDLADDIRGGRQHGSVAVHVWLV